MDSTQSHNLALSKKAFEAVSPKLDDETRAQNHEFIYEANEWGLRENEGQVLPRASGNKMQEGI